VGGLGDLVLPCTDATAGLLEGDREGVLEGVRLGYLPGFNVGVADDLTGF